MSLFPTLETKTRYSLAPYSKLAVGSSLLGGIISDHIIVRYNGQCLSSPYFTPCLRPSAQLPQAGWVEWQRGKTCTKAPRTWAVGTVGLCSNHDIIQPWITERGLRSKTLLFDDKDNVTSHKIFNLYQLYFNFNLYSHYRR